MKLDVTEVLQGLNKLEGLTRSLINQGLKAGIGQAFKLADDRVPKTPRDKGDLKAKKGVSPIDIKGDIVKKQFGYKMPYAARWHNETRTDINWTEAGSGPNYLGSKLENYKESILESIGVEIEQELKKRGK